MAVYVGRIMGIPIRLDYTALIIFLLIAWSVGFEWMPQAYPGVGELAYLSVGLLSAFLLFASILVHELAHSAVAKRNGLRIRQITLFLFGGVSEMEEEPGNPMLELKMSAAGPLTSVVLAVASGLGWWLSGQLRSSPLVQAPLEYMMLVNGIVAVFNLIPAFPMDGGRVFRSLLWMRNRDVLRATRVASNVGKGFAYALIFLGIFFLLTVDFVTGFWFVIIGWFISSGAQSGLTQTIIQEDLRGMRARDVMTRSVDAVSPEITLDALSSEFMRLKHNGFPVISGDELRGCVTTEDLRKAKRESWGATRVSEVMTPRERLVTLKENEVATRALSLMGTNRIGRVFVLNEEGRLAGIITRSDILKVIQMKEVMPGGGAAGGGGGEVSFTAELGMNFVLEQPMEEGFDWAAEFPAEGVELLGQAVVKTSDELEVKRFTLQARKQGRYVINLVQNPVEGEGGRPVRTVRYTVKVG